MDANYPQFDKSIKNKAIEEALISFPKFGVETKWIDITENGITIKQFNKMVKRVYEKGYADGLEKHREISEADRAGKSLVRFKRISKEISNENLSWKK